MLKILLTVIFGALLGLGVGKFQAFFLNRGFEERFTEARETLAEERGEFSAQEIRSQDTGAKLEIVDGPMYNFGVMQHGETMSHAFTFKNIGSGPMNLSMGGSTCKCTVGDLESSVLQPGEETSVKLTWTASAITRDFAQTATIYTTDPDHDEVQLSIRGRIAHSFSIEPSSLSLSNISTSEGLSRKFHVFTYLKDSEELLDFEWSDEDTREFVQIDCKPVVLEGAEREEFAHHKNALKVHEVTVELKPGLRLGPISSRITFATDLGEKTGQLEVPVTGSVTGEITLFGGSSFNADLNLIDLGQVKQGETGSATVWMAVQGENRDSIVPTVETVEPEAALKVTIDEPSIRGSRKVFPLRFEVPKDAPEVYYPGGTKKSFGKVVLKTNQGESKELLIYVRLTVTR